MAAGRLVSRRPAASPSRVPGTDMLLTSLYVASLAFFTGQPKAVFPQTAFDFGKVIGGKLLQQEFKLSNQGDAPLRIRKISMTAPLRLAGIPKEIPPGGEAGILFKLDTSLVRGLFEGKILVFLNDPNLPEMRLTFEGRVISTVEVSPRPAFFLAARRGESREASVEIVNHEAEPLSIQRIQHSNERFTSRLETLADGRRYRLTLSLKPNGPGGRHSEPILLTTSSSNHPQLKILANTHLRERVYVFPEEVDLGVLRVGSIRDNPEALKSLAQTVVVHQAGGTAFKVSARTNLRELKLKTERGDQGDRYEVTVTLSQEKLEPGRIQGAIVIETNDPEFPSLTVPVSGYVLE